MGTQFWWFYDAMIVAITLVTVFLSARSGFMKSMLSVVGYVISLIVSFSLCGVISSGVYNTAIRQGDMNNIREDLSHFDLKFETTSYINTLGYNVTVDNKNLSEIFTGDGDIYDELYNYLNNVNGRVVDDKESFDKKINEGFAIMMRDFLTDTHSDYIGSSAYDKCISDPDKVKRAVYLIETDSMEPEAATYTDSAKYIEDNFAADAYKDAIKVLSFIILTAVLLLLIFSIIRKSGSGNMGEITDRILGGAMGILSSAAIIVILSVVVKAVIMFSGNEMMLFNTDTIEKTFVFRHIYRLISGL